MESDLRRFKEIIRGKIKEELRQFISNGGVILRKSGQNITIPMPSIEIPTFSFGDEEKSGEGGGSEDSSANKSEKDSGQKGKATGAGAEEGEHSLEMDVPLEELADILGEELKLPNIRSSGYGEASSKNYRYTSVHKEGPNSLNIFRQTYLKALKRSISSGEYNAQNPKIIPIKEDRRFLTAKETFKQCSNAAIIYMMDVSGSMGDEQKEIVRLTSFWIDTWLSKYYKGLAKRYIIHDATAKEVDSNVFYRTKESGGTLISSAYKLALEIIGKNYQNDDWNVYLFHFSDGDNWSGNDTLECLKLIEEKMINIVNLFCYGQVESRYGSGQFLRELVKKFGESQEKIALAAIKDRNAIIDSLKIFLGRGR